MRALALALAVAVAACAAPKPSAVEAPREGEVLPFDLVPRGFDDNGLGLDPELGWHFNSRCHVGGAAGQQRDPARCSWRFIDDGTQARTSRPPCNSHFMDPDFSTFVLSRLAITCSDSPLRFPGHVNWGARYGGGATYEGWLTWEGFSGGLPFGDFDFNFVLTLPDEHALATAAGDDWDWIGVEFDSREVAGFASPWWAGLRSRVDTAPLEVEAYVGRPYAIVTGLLGIDAEHMSRRDPAVELHPAYSMALRVEAGSAGTVRTERWAIFARDRGDEGLCSDWDRVHVMPLLGGAHAVRLPWRQGMADVRLGAGTTFCTSGEGSPTVTVAFDDEHRGVVVRFEMAPGAIVDGDLHLEWSGPPSAADAAGEPAKPARRRRPTRELEDPAVAEQALAHVRADPAEWDAYRAAARPPACKAVPVRLVKSPVPERASRRSDCRAPTPPVSDARARQLGLPAAAQAAATRASPPEPPAPTVTAGPSRREVQTPRERYCAERAGKSPAAARFCAQGESD